jgi:RHS repeat-associated protein
VGQSDAAGVTTWAATYQADGRRTGEIGTNLNPKQVTGRVRELGVNRDRHRANTKEEDPTGLLNEGFRYRDMETGTFISRDPLGHVDGPNVYCYVRQNPWTMWDPEGLFVGALVKRINEHVIRPAAESFVSAVIDALPQSAVEQLSNSRGFESAMEAGRTVSRGIMHGSQEALGMLSPMDGAADKLLKGDLRGAGNEAMLEAFGGRVFKAAGKGIAAVKRHAGQLDEAVGALSHADDAATATATGVRESIEEASSVLAKEGGGVAKSAPWTQVSSDARAILRDVEGRTGMTIPSKQRSLLADQVRTVDHQIPVSDAQYKALQAQYRSSRPSMIADWEANTGQVWPSGEQAHHIIPTRYGGPNQWWNIHPAQGSVHQGGIHGVGSPTQSVFPTPVPR